MKLINYIEAIHGMCASIMAVKELQMHGAESDLITSICRREHFDVYIKRNKNTSTEFKPCKTLVDERHSLTRSVYHILPDASGRKTSESFITKDGDGGIEKRIDARSDKNR